MRTPSLCTCLMSVALLSLVACGGGDDESYDEDDSGYVASQEAFDESELPTDFPRDLIPPDYHTGGYAELGEVSGASFESSAPVQESIDYYTELLGEPKLAVDSGDGDRLVQWHETPYPPWVVGVLGNDGESVISVSKLPAE